MTMLWLMLLSSSLALARADFPADPCWVEGQTCRVGSDGILDSVPSIPDVATCRQLCQDTDGCNFLSYFGPESFPFREHCFLLRDDFIYYLPTLGPTFVD